MSQSRRHGTGLIRFPDTKKKKGLAAQLNFSGVFAIVQIFMSCGAILVPVVPVCFTSHARQYASRHLG